MVQILYQDVFSLKLSFEKRAERQGAIHGSEKNREERPGFCERRPEIQAGLLHKRPCQLEEDVKILISLQ